MRLINERTMVRAVVVRWRAQYPAGSATMHGPTDPVYERLLKLDPETATAADVDGAIGVRGWAEVPACDDCGMAAASVVEMGQPPDYESSTANLCAPCLRRALELVGG